MTEIPEHLLKRSRERRAALGLGGGDDGGDTGDEAKAPSGAVPAKAESAAPAAPAPSGPAPRGPAPAPPTPAPPAKVHPTVVAARSRRKIPFWAMAALSLMPVWLFMYARALTDQAEAAAGPIGVGEELYGACAACHGGAGGGGVGYAFTGGEVLLTFPNIEDQIRYTYFGTGAYNAAGVTIYGDPDREGGPHITGALGIMPQFGQLAGGGLTDYELLGVVCYERFTLGGALPTDDAYADEYERWCSEESPIFQGLASGQLDLTTMEDMIDDIIPIGTEPVPGSGPAGP